MESWQNGYCTGLVPKEWLRQKPASKRKRYMPFAYILKSLKDKKYYYGSTNNLEQRLKKHNKGKVRSTKGRRPLIVHYFEEFHNIQEARKREIYFKSINGYCWLKAQGII